ncbi:MAG: uracil-DNA glycosylase [Aquificota bacterium]|nr:MAG: uracil-DNA glycosylase [Aquificota bacterium]
MLNSNYLKILKEIGIDEIFIKRGNMIEDKIKILEKINKEIQECKKCDLYKNRKQAVLGEGNPDTKLMFIGEAPGADEDKLGRPFVGRAGKLLTSIIESLGYKREQFYIANVNKCRPPGNRTPTPWEQEACFPFLEKQIDIINPNVLCLLGAAAARAFLQRNVAITKERGKILNWKDKKLILTFHPAYVLRNPSAESLLTKDIEKAIELAYFN